MLFLNGIKVWNIVVKKFKIFKVMVFVGKKRKVVFIVDGFEI